MNKKLRCVVLYSSGHLGSNTVLNKLQAMDEFEIVGLVRCETVTFTKKGLKKSLQHIAQLGYRFTLKLIWQRIIQMFMALCSRLLPKQRKIRPGWVLSTKHRIPVLNCDSVNSTASKAWIASQQPDLLISAYFTQILKQPLIDLPTVGVLNIHPGWLPQYRGAMCYFWVLRNNESHAGVSVHWIDAGIDTGRLLARRKIRLNMRSTQERVLYLSAVIGSRLLQRIGRQLLANETPLSIDVSNETAHYYSMPQEADYKSYAQQHRFFRIRDIMSLLYCRSM